ncbi:hypothetical protein HZS_7952 [Henneguya salminicola]|nr:hypothetical protein HZS_7952 [Henneguya salminicola]
MGMLKLKKNYENIKKYLFKTVWVHISFDFKYHAQFEGLSGLIQLSSLITY